MKKINKVIPYAFFGLVFFTFFLSFISCIVQIGAVIKLCSNFSNSWAMVISWVFDLVLSILLILLSLKTIWNIYKCQDENGTTFFKANCLLITFYCIERSLSWLLTVIMYGSSGVEVDLSALIVLILLLIGAIVFLVLGAFMYNRIKYHKSFAGIGYFLLFITLIFQASLGVGGFGRAIMWFLFLAAIVGAIHIGTYDLDLMTLYNRLKITGGQDDSSSSSKDDKVINNDVAQSLLSLKELYDKGIIDEHDYEEKRKSLIEKL